MSRRDKPSSASIAKEPTFVKAALIQSARDPDVIMNYEVWNGTPESSCKPDHQELSCGVREVNLGSQDRADPGLVLLIADWKLI